MRAKEILTTIMEQPTAYSVDNVISQLEDYGNEEIDYYQDTPYANCIRECVSKAIEIVKQGGVSDASDNVCEWFKYDYRTICPKNHDTNNPYWRIPDNMDKLKYCPYCGKKIKVTQSDN